VETDTSSGGRPLGGEDAEDADQTLEDPAAETPQADETTKIV